MCAEKLVAAYAPQFKGFGALYETVPAGGTSNFYWAMIQYAPILITFAFSSSMVQTLVALAAVCRRCGQTKSLTHPTRRRHP